MMLTAKRLFLACFLFFLAVPEVVHALDEWTTFQENESFSISYQRIHCNDRSNGVAFDFFAIRLENKSQQKINLQWFNKPGDDEQYVSIILAPGEVMQGSCDSYANNHLMVLIQAESVKAIAKPHFADFKFYRL